MRIRPNRTVLEGEVLRIRRAKDGVGADVTLRIDANLGGGKDDDMTGAKAGDTLTVFAAVPEALAAGHCFRLEASVLGVPGGERIVVAKAVEIGKP
jgi:hypothetical protein